MNDHPAPVVVKPAKELLTDTNYGSTENVIECEKRDPETGKPRAFFDGKGCEACPHGDSCPAKPLRDGGRVLRSTVHAVVLARRRRYETTKEFKKRYAERAVAPGAGRMAGFVAGRRRVTPAARPACLRSETVRVHARQVRGPAVSGPVHGRLGGAVACRS